MISVKFFKNTMSRKDHMTFVVWPSLSINRYAILACRKPGEPTKTDRYVWVINLRLWIWWLCIKYKKAKK